MSDYQSGYLAGKNAGSSSSPAYNPWEVQDELYYQGLAQSLQNQSNKYQNLLNRFQNLVADYNNLVTRFNLRGEQITHAHNALEHEEEAHAHAKKAHALAKDQVNILETGFHYQLAAHSMLAKLPYLATTAKDTGGYGDELRQYIADLRNLPDGEKEYQELISYMEHAGRSIADEAVLAPYLNNEIELLKVSTQMRDPRTWIQKRMETRQYLRERVNNPMPVPWPDRPEKLLKVMDTATQITEAALEHRFMIYFYHVLMNHLFQAISGHMMQGKDCTQPEPVSAALEEALGLDVFPFFPEQRRAFFGSTLREDMIDGNGNHLGSYGNGLRYNIAQVLGAMDELHLLRKGLRPAGGLLPAIPQIPQAANLQPDGKDGKDGKDVKRENPGGWGATGTGTPSPQERGNPWAQKAPEPPKNDQPPLQSWGGPSPS